MKTIGGIFIFIYALLLFTHLAAYAFAFGEYYIGFITSFFVFVVVLCAVGNADIHLVIQRVLSTETVDKS